MHDAKPSAKTAENLEVASRERFWSVRVTGNWRIIFRFENGAAQDLDLTDYH
ncbi:type II toxin-antitoxin system RelE/ParE family toxin [Nitrosospira multiformis]|uniref:type II toxin-antitoxin system RelE/ParE family toxin n=1 Tax=Nitrosospira multiformis TaxID=1231 RepID=UPI000D30AB11|nr:type II toxin-antitoxin system RelE/ParE family toxin [Nitrosospira multiformis]